MVLPDDGETYLAGFNLTVPAGQVKVIQGAADWDGTGFLMGDMWINGVLTLNILLKSAAFW